MKNKKILIESTKTRVLNNGEKLQEDFMLIYDEKGGACIEVAMNPFSILMTIENGYNFDKNDDEYLKNYPFCPINAYPYDSLFDDCFESTMSYLSEFDFNEDMYIDNEFLIELKKMLLDCDEEEIKRLMNMYANVICYIIKH